MKLHSSEFFYALATLSMAFVGFSAIVAVLHQGRKGDRYHEKRRTYHQTERLFGDRHPRSARSCAEGGRLQDICAARSCRRGDIGRSEDAASHSAGVW